MVNIFRFLLALILFFFTFDGFGQEKTKWDSIQKSHEARLKKTLKRIEAINKRNNRKKLNFDSLKIVNDQKIKKRNESKKIALIKTDSTNKNSKGQIVQVLKSDLFRREKTDSFNAFNILIGNVLMKQDNTLFYCDSAIQNIGSNIIEAFGNVHINDSDSIHTYSDYAKYFGETRIATLKTNVRLTDNKVVLTTENLEYDLNANLGTYLDGGKVVNGQSVLTSTQGYYYADTKDVYFQKNVLLLDPEYTMNTDTLLYNVKTEIASIVAITTIRDDKTRIKTNKGFYNLKSGKAKFSNRPILVDSVQLIIADNMNYDKISGVGNGEGNVFYRDSSQGISMLSGGVLFNTNSKEVTSYRNPVLMMKQDNDNLYLTADTLYSAYQRVEIKKEKNNDRLNQAQDSSKQKNQLFLNASPASSNTLAIDSTIDVKKNLDKIKKNLTPENIKDSTKKYKGEDSIINMALSENKKADSIIYKTDSAKKEIKLVSNAIKDPKENEVPNDSVRYFKGYNNARMYSDSIQGKCDSIYYSLLDSVFKFYKDPVIWANGNQVSGDFIMLTTKDKQAHEFIIDQNAISISNTGDGLFNQLRGSKMIGTFKEGEIDSIRAIGTAQSLYYLQDDDSAYVGMDYTEANNIIMTFKNRELKKVIWVKGAKGTTYPLNKIPDDKRQLPNFKWLEAIRPKSFGELFGR